MKHTAKRLFSIAILVMGFALSSQAQRVYVSVRPAAPVVVARPVAPSPRHVWIEGEYEWRSGAYVYRPGYWSVPPARYHEYRRGYWRHERGGYYWVPGRWR